MLELSHQRTPVVSFHSCSFFGTSNFRWKGCPIRPMERHQVHVLVLDAGFRVVYKACIRVLNDRPATFDGKT
jgi:hypothetical protein